MPDMDKRQTRSFNFLVPGVGLEEFSTPEKLLQDHLASCFYNHNELDLRNGFFREEEVFV
jgi:hypothetical protein